MDSIFREDFNNEETGLISNLVDDLEKPETAPECATIGITKWVGELKKQNNDFTNLLDQRNKEYAHKISGDVKAARAVIDPLYESMVSRLNGMVTLDMAGAEAQTFIKELNQKIKYYETIIAARNGKKENREENNPVQPEGEDPVNGSD